MSLNKSIGCQSKNDLINAYVLLFLSIYIISLLYIWLKYFPLLTRILQLEIQHLSLCNLIGGRDGDIMVCRNIGPSLWNSLDYECKNISDLNTFKHTLKSNFFDVIRKKENDIYNY